LEKQLYRGNLEIKYVTSRNRFVNTYCNYQNLKNYFLPETEIEYLGNAFNFSFEDGKFKIDPNIGQVRFFYPNRTLKKYIVPKIMYIPAERNFFSVVKGAEKVKGLPQSNCIEILRSDGTMDNRCDGMLTYNKHIIFVELKERNFRNSWVVKGEKQLKNTINVFIANHDLAIYKFKIAHIANNKQPDFQSSQMIRMERFKNETGFRLIIQNTIKVS